MRGKRAKSIPAAAYPSARVVGYRQYQIGTSGGTVIADAVRQACQQGKRAVREVRQRKNIPEPPETRHQRYIRLRFDDTAKYVPFEVADA
jgi:hypothetical protein